mmetsp:Transcript_4508/g.9898  ORF Transcript_4508/g.9898 Transcript_4508/m.9898 type:complete len:127 (+) Transcript_4508:90-470(+)
MEYNYSEHVDAQKGPPCCSFGSFWNVHPDAENILLASLYGNLSLHAQRSWLKAEAPKNMKAISVTEETFHSERSELKAEAFKNMKAIPVTEETSHFEMSSLKVLISLNKNNMSVTCPTHHEFIGYP